MVTASGYGFLPETVVEFLLPDSDTLHPGITVTDSEYVSPTELRLTVTVAAGAQFVTGAPIAFDNPGRPV